MMKRLFLLMFTAFAVSGAVATAEESADDLVLRALEYWRDNSSYTEAEMTIHRPDWERSMALRAWTKRNDKTMVRFTAPKKDAGNASLTIEEEMWSYNPKVNRIIKIPASMKGQSWMGSDFSYRDLSKSDEIVRYYEHTLLSEELQDGKKVFHIRSVPNEDAPVVWGKEELWIREDLIILEHIFFDQDLQPIKKLRASEIEPLGGKLFATVIRMEQLEEPEKWTEVRHTAAQFDIDISERIFSLAYLRNPR